MLEVNESIALKPEAAILLLSSYKPFLAFAITVQSSAV